MRFHGTVYQADNWICAGDTKGLRRIPRLFRIFANHDNIVSLNAILGNYDPIRIATYLFTIFSGLVNHCLWLGCEASLLPDAGEIP